MTGQVSSSSSSLSLSLPSSILSPRQQQTLQSLVDTILPPLPVPLWEKEQSLDNPNLSKITETSRFWTFCLSYDPGFWHALEQRLVVVQSTSTTTTTTTTSMAHDHIHPPADSDPPHNDDDNDESEEEEEEEAFCKATLHMLDLLSTEEGTRTLLSDDSSFINKKKTETMAFVDWSKDEQMEWIQTVLRPTSTSPDHHRHRKHQQYKQQEQQRQWLCQLQHWICQTAFTYHPAMSTQTALVRVEPNSNDNKKNNVPNNNVPVKLQALNPFWKAMGYPGTAAKYLGRIRDAQAIVMVRKQQQHQHHAPHTEQNQQQQQREPYQLPPRPPFAHHPPILKDKDGQEQQQQQEPSDDDASHDSCHDASHNNQDRDVAVLECDVVIVGSGASGSVAAAVLSLSGHHVMVVEEGPRGPSHCYSATITEQDMHQFWRPRQYCSFSTLSSSTSHHGRGPAGTGVIALNQARVVGGSAYCHHTGACLPLPPWLRDDWVQRFGLLDLQPNGPFDSSLHHVLQRLHVSPPSPHDQHSVANQQLRNAALQLGYPWQAISQNVHPRIDQYHYAATLKRYDASSKDTSGFVALGDRYGQRETASLAYLGDAAQTQKCHLLDRCRITRIETTTTMVGSSGMRIATGVSGYSYLEDEEDNRGDDGSNEESSPASATTTTRRRRKKKQEILIQARKCVVLAGGALSSPLLLQRSGIAKHNPHLGQHLKLQPNVAILGFPTVNSKDGGAGGDNNNNKGNDSTNGPMQQQQQMINAFEGPAQSILCTPPPPPPLTNSPQGSEEDKDGSPRVVIQAASLHPGWMALQLPYTTPLQFKSWMRQFRTCVPLVCTLKDDNCQGSVRLADHNNHYIHWWRSSSSRSSPLPSWRMQVEYTMDALDHARLSQGLLAATRLQIAAGAKDVTTAHGGLLDDDIDMNSSLGGGHYQHYLESRSLPTVEGMESSCYLYSDVQLGSCRMSAVPDQGVVDMYGEVWDCNQLYVMDGSLFPTATLVHPLLTLATFAHMLSTKLALRLRAGDDDLTQDEASRVHEMELVRNHTRHHVVTAATAATAALQPQQQQQQQEPKMQSFNATTTGSITTTVTATTKSTTTTAIIPKATKLLLMMGFGTILLMLLLTLLDMDLFSFLFSSTTSNK